MIDSLASDALVGQTARAAAAARLAAVLEELKGKANVIAVDALALAEQAGSPKAVNVVLTGVLSKAMDLDESVWQQSLETTVPPKFLELNKKAFQLGRES